MKIRSKCLQHLHLDPNYSLLTARSVNISLHLFNQLDIHKENGLNDIQFCQFMTTVTDLNKSKIYKVFDMLDVDASGEIEFDEFYLLLCILIANKDNEEKQFIYRHSRTVFDLLDEDGSKTISADEFENFGFLFNFQGDAVRRIFNEFDISGDQELDYKEFRMFAMACIDKQKELRELKKRRRLEQRNGFCNNLIGRFLGLFQNTNVDQSVTFYKEGEAHPLEKAKKTRASSMTMSVGLTSPSRMSTTPSRMSTTPSRMSTTPSRMSTTPSRMSTAP